MSALVQEGTVPGAKDAPGTVTERLRGPGRAVAEQHCDGYHGGQEQRKAESSLHRTASLRSTLRQPLAPVVT
ncbi:MAG: hypothetical protein ACRDLK_03850, partial [Gaiellaceae bacterium]